MVMKSGMGPNGAWRLAPCLVAMIDEADRIAPKRSTASDGSIGDAAHSARTSDHNPDVEPGPDWVDALDITHDPGDGMDIHAKLRVIANRVKLGLEDRVSYLISNDEIFSEKNGVWAWRPYSGSNEHRQHGHISVNDQNRHKTGPWFFTSAAQPKPPASKPTAPIEEDYLMPTIFVCEGKGIMHITCGFATTLTLDEFKVVTESYRQRGIKFDEQRCNARRWAQLEKQMV